VASPNSPLDASTFIEAELQAAVEAAENWGTYATAHAYTPVSIQRAIAAGVKCFCSGHVWHCSGYRCLAQPYTSGPGRRSFWIYGRFCRHCREGYFGAFGHGSPTTGDEG
jgi:imidazolonepropionase-like amidohydrolase